MMGELVGRQLQSGHQGLLKDLGLLGGMEVSWRVSLVLEVSCCGFRDLEGHRALTSEEHIPGFWGRSL